jgi:hypothetical protein
MTDRTKRALALVIFLICVLGILVDLRASRSLGQTRGTNSFSDWRPGQDTNGIGYVGTSKCVKCHSAQAATQPATPMGHALALVADCQILSSRPLLTFRNGSYTYRITREGDRSIYSVTDGVNTVSEPILYCFGQGKVGQTYSFRHNGSFYESRISYYSGVDGLDFTIGQRRSIPTSLEEALGRAVAPAETRSCFGCHSTGAVNGSQFTLDQLIPGIGCEACHGPGEKHIAAVRAGKVKDLQIFNPGILDASNLTQSFCGSCHTSFEQAMVLPGQGGPNNIRFQPYRIFNSPGHNLNDYRISCVACHDPHKPLERDAMFYDSKCLACHIADPKAALTKRRTAPACPVSNKQCVTCHMPKSELPGMHSEFTDHWIRVAKPDDPIPH